MLEAYSVHAASKRDLNVIRRWLFAEFRRDGEGFYHNYLSPGRGSVWVCKPTGHSSVLGFLSGDLGATPSLGIMQVREKFKRKGIGRQLVTFFLQLAKQYDPLGIEIQCAPMSSIPFWSEMGFVEVRRSYQDDSTNLHFRAWNFQTSSQLPHGMKRVKVRLTLSGFKGMPSTKEFTTAAALVDGQIHLQQHFVAYIDDADAYMEVNVEGVSIFKDKVKRCNALGAERVAPFIRLKVIQPATVAP